MGFTFQVLLKGKPKETPKSSGPELWMKHAGVLCRTLVINKLLSTFALFGKHP